jgi:hypothetical protein
MNKTIGLLLGALYVLCGSSALAQNYKCDWCVNGLGGGDMSSAAYRCGSTAGQTAAGQLTGTAYWAYIGFWQAEMQVGLAEGQTLPQASSFTLQVRPNPFSGTVAIRYSLASDGPAMLQVYDRVGRLVRSWAVGRKPAAVSFVTWDGRDSRGRLLSNGVYFCRLTAGAFRSTEKLVMQR